jgi:hypothetical protein
MRRIDTGELVSAAETRGGSAFPTREFVEPLDRFVDSVETEGNLTDLGVEGLRQDLVRLLENRLAIDTAFADHPEIGEEDVSDPVVITGLPRTGTTKLQKVLAASGGYHKLPLWQALLPVPLPAPGSEPDPRIGAIEEQSRLMFEMFPDLMAAHPMRATEPEEEVLLLQLSFLEPTNGWFYRAPSYVNWVEQQDRTPAYETLRRTLQYLQWQNGGRDGRSWVLKSPAHLGAIALVFKVFPNATVVHCHRDLREALPSLARLLELMQIARGAAHVDNAELGAFLVEYCAGLWERNLAQRAALPAEQILDLRYEDIHTNIGAVVDEIHERRGVLLDANARAAVLDWEKSNPQHRYGNHVYSLGRYGLSEADLKAAFADYDERF